MRSVAKHSFIKGANGKARAKAHVNYIQYRRGEDREGSQARPFFSADKDKIQGREVKLDIDQMERSKVVVHKLILSPGIENVNIESYTRAVMKQLGREKGLELDWRAVVHKNTDHDHSHVVVFGKDKNGREVFLTRHDYARMRDAGDRYLIKRHRFDHQMARIQEPERLHYKEYAVDRGDPLYDELRGIKREEEKSPPVSAAYEPRKWDLEKAVERLPLSEKIYYDNVFYSKYNTREVLEDLIAE